MKIVVSIATIDPRHGGPARTVPALCRALAKSGADLELVTIAEHHREIGSSSEEGFATTVIRTDADRYHARSWAKQFKEALQNAARSKEHGGNETVFYDVGLWLPSNHFAAQMARGTRIPLISSPRGMLSKEALKVSKLK